MRTITLNQKQPARSGIIKAPILAAVCVCALASARIQAQTVQNASFEAPSLGGGSRYQPTNAAWIFTPFSGIVGHSANWGFPVAPDGVQAAILQSWGSGTPVPGTNSQISQTISGFTVGLNYIVKFSAAQRNLGQNKIQNQDFNVLLDDTLLGHFQPTGATFQNFTTAPFTATATNHTLRFVALNSAGYTVNGHGDNTAFIDNVRIESNNVLYTLQMQGSASAAGPFTNFALPVFLTNPPAPQMFFRISLSQTRF